MGDKANELDNESMHSDDSCTSTLSTTLKESLEYSINKTMKDFSAYNDLELRNRFLKVEEENVSLYCRHLESQIKKRNERLEELHEKYKNCLTINSSESEKQLLAAQTNLKTVGDLFRIAFEKYSSNSERKVINQCLQELENQEKEFKRLTNEMNELQHTEKMNDSILKSKTSERTRLEQVIKQLSLNLSVINRSNEKVEEESDALSKTIKQLESRLNVLKAILKNN